MSTKMRRCSRQATRDIQRADCGAARSLFHGGILKDRRSRTGVTRDMALQGLFGRQQLSTTTRKHAAHGIGLPSCGSYWNQRQHDTLMVVWIEPQVMDSARPMTKLASTSTSNGYRPAALKRMYRIPGLGRVNGRAHRQLQVRGRSRIHRS